MAVPIMRDGSVSPQEIEDLREAVGWDRSEGTVSLALQRSHRFYVARDESGRLVGYLSVISDGVADAFLVDLAVHPDFQRHGLGKRMVTCAVDDVRGEGIRCVQVTFSPELRPFYAACGFSIFGGGIIDFGALEDDTRRPGAG